jgi:hypothetical protein
MTTIQRAIAFLDGFTEDRPKEIAAELREIQALEHTSMDLQAKPDCWMLTGLDIVTGEEIEVPFTCDEHDDHDFDPLKCIMANISRLGSAMNFYRESDAEGLAQLGREHRESVKLLEELLGRRRISEQSRECAALRLAKAIGIDRERIHRALVQQGLWLCPIGPEVAQ